MEKWENFTMNSDLLFCLKNEKEIVLKQNEACIHFCGNHQGECCSDKCMKYLNQAPQSIECDLGHRTFQNKIINEEYFDIIFIKDGKTIVTLLFPLKKKHQNAYHCFKELDLSHRELEVIKLKIKGISNKEAAKKLSISISTLKTHINNIYKKIPTNSKCLNYLNCSH